MSNALISSLLKRLSDMNMSGECDNLSDEQREFMLDSLLSIIGKEDITFCKYKAIKYLGISRALFDNLRREGKLPKGIKELGGTLRFKKKDLDNFIKQRNDKENKRLVSNNL